jgi:hypothetical protein
MVILHILQVWFEDGEPHNRHFVKAVFFIVVGLALILLTAL